MRSSNKMKYIKVLAASLLLGLSNYSLAISTNVVDCSSKSQNGLDYGNATGQASSACHDTDQWQKLGNTWNPDSPSTTETNPATNDGVSWTTSADNGQTWVDNGELTSEGLVVFQFDVTRATVGNHKYDLLKSWVDWDQNGAWSEDETIIAKEWWKDLDSEGVQQAPLIIDNNGGGDGTKNWDLSNYRSEDVFNSQDTSATFFTEAITIPALDTLKDIWLRARVVCENSLEHYADEMNLISTGYQHQGEVEDYKLVIAKKVTTTDVPEPSILIIFMLGLIALISKKKNFY